MDVDVVDGEVCHLSMSSMQLALGDVDDEQSSRTSDDSSEHKKQDQLSELVSSKDMLLNVACDFSAKELQDANASNFPLDIAVAMPRDLAGAALTLCCGTGQPDVETTVNSQPHVQTEETKQPKPSEGCLLRLFESQVFDMSMAISYLFNSKEPGVQSYLGKLSFALLK